ncbi:MAG: hypothetical protein EZS28_042370, partial [Streblomastix strix]
SDSCTRTDRIGATMVSQQRGEIRRYGDNKSKLQFWDVFLTKRHNILTKMRDMPDIEDKSMKNTKINYSKLYNTRGTTSSLWARRHQ